MPSMLIIGLPGCPRQRSPVGTSGSARSLYAVCVALAGTEQLIGSRHHGFGRAANRFKKRAEVDADCRKEIRPSMVWEPRGCEERST